MKTNEASQCGPPPPIFLKRPFKVSVSRISLSAFRFSLFPPRA
jgi:hypothetical protein